MCSTQIINCKIHSLDDKADSHTAAWHTWLHLYRQVRLLLAFTQLNAKRDVMLARIVKIQAHSGPHPHCVLIATSTAQMGSNCVLISCCIVGCYRMLLQQVYGCFSLSTVYIGEPLRGGLIGFNRSLSILTMLLPDKAGSAELQLSRCLDNVVYRHRKTATPTSKNPMPSNTKPACNWPCLQAKQLCCNVCNS